MEEKRWTEAQREAMSCDCPDILVSAAAGSGKTAVLTKRIIDKLTDKEHPADISRMLIVTFTKAAAGELKERIAKAVSAAIAEDPANKQLQRQYVLLSKARISTIHSFCLDLVRQNFQKLGLSPNVTVSDPGQSALLMEQVADVVIDNYYSKLPGYDDIEDFVTFGDNFITLQDDGLSTILISLYKKVLCYPQGIEFLAESAAEFEKAEQEGLRATVWGKLIFSHLSSIASYYKTVFEKACEYFDNETFQNYYPAFLHEYQYADRLLQAVTSEDDQEILTLLTTHKKINLGSVKSDLQTEKSDFFRDARKSFDADLSSFYSNYLASSEEELASTAAESRRFIEDLYRFLRSFDAKYRYEKRIRGIVDFNDLERLTCSLLSEQDGSPTELARSLSAQFDEIYIDEYQDVNTVQDRIFSSIAKNTKRFMVGDIKQSIYGFQGSEPSLFADYRLDDRVKKVYLRDNFRSERPVIDFANTVCGALFRFAGRTVPYDTTDELVCGKDEIRKNQREADANVNEEALQEVEIAVIGATAKNADVRRSEEAEYVADRIAEMLKEGTKPSDICILLRATARSSADYQTALENRGIPCRNRITKDLFVNPEVLLVLNLLHVIDNPTRDIYLAGALKSPIYNVSISELAVIRRHRPNGCLYEALRAYVEDTGFAKGRYFLDKLAEYRAMSSEPVDKLIWHLFNDADIFALATGERESLGVSDKRANLLLLYEYARKFESGSFKGLYNFIRYISDVLDSGAGFSSAPASSGSENVVRIMSIHQSKGLEFPIVFLCDCGSGVGGKDRVKRVLLDRHFGTTLKLPDSTGLASIDTVFRRAEGLGITKKEYDEEIRVLYVALTRPIRRLIVTGATANPERLLAQCELLSEIASPDTDYLFYKNAGFLSWILIAAGRAYTPVLHMVDDCSSDEIGLSFDEGEAIVPFDEERIAELADEYRRRFEYRYPKGAASALPAKLSVSELYPSILDEYDDAAKLADTRQSRMRLPRFRQETRDTAADRGTATHQFMQFCDFARLATCDVEDEIDRLVRCHYLDTHTASLIDRDMLTDFLKSDVFSALSSAQDLRRELRFNVRLPASAFTVDPETKASLQNESVLVQGIMDCVYTDSEGRLTVLDYKTDRIPKELLGDEDAFCALLIQRHREQLSYYKAACTAMTCRPVNRVLLYSFALGRAVDVPFSDLIDL